MAALDAIKLAEKLQGFGEECWVHIEAAGPLEKYPAKQHGRRVRDQLGVTRGLIYLPGQLARNNEDSDMPAPFRQRRYFYYLSGCNEPNCHLTYDIQHDSLALFIPRIDPERVIWNGRGSTPTEALDKYDIDAVYFTDELQAWVRSWSMRNRGDIYVLRKSQTPEMQYPIRRLDYTSLQPAIDLARVIKDEHEIKLIRKANDISSEAHKQVLANITKFSNEAQVEGRFKDECISKQAKRQAYNVIAASGPNAGTLHYDANNEDFDDRQLICLDAGCEYECYASDITRTFPLSGYWSSEAENIYKLVQRMQDACIERLAPGVRYLDLHVLAHQIAIDGLLQLGILHNGTREEIYKAGTSRAFFPHGLGHHVGLEVHDVGQKGLTSAYTRNLKYEKVPSLYPENFHLPVYDEELCQAPTDPQSPHLEEDMVITVEPGIYFSSYALNHFYLPSPVHSKYINSDILAKYFPVGGVRIEDDVLITSKGHENLTTAPKGEAMLEIIRNQNANWPFHSDASTPQVERKEVIEQPLLRAPGIPKRVSDPRLKPISRAATAPFERPRNRGSGDFEPFNGPSLFSGFRRSTTTDENIERWKAYRSGQTLSHTRRMNGESLCGEVSSDAQHIYMTSSPMHGNEFTVSSGYYKIKKPTCNKCAVLSQTLSRLREQLKHSERASLKLDQHHTMPPEPAAMRKTLETRQTCLKTHSMEHGAPAYPHLATGSNTKPNGSKSSPLGTYRTPEKEMRGWGNANMSAIHNEILHRRSTTFDSYPQPRNPRKTKSSAPILTPRAEETIPPLHGYRTSTHPHMLQQTQSSLQHVTNRDTSATRELEREAHVQQFMRGPTARASLPLLRQDYPVTLTTAMPSLNGHSTMPQAHPHTQIQPPFTSHHPNAIQSSASIPPPPITYHRQQLALESSLQPQTSVQDMSLDELKRELEDMWMRVQRSLATA